MLVYIAVLLPVLVLFCGLVVDVGQLEVRRLQMQSASDAAAIGAALELERSGTAGSYVSMGKGDASVNGFTDGTNSASVSVQVVPTYGDYAGFYDAVQTNISQPIGLSFLNLISKKASTVSTQSTALVAPCGYVTGAANLVTNSFTGTSATMTAGCPWYFYRTVKTDSASTFNALATNVVGPSGSSTWSASGGPTPRYGVASASDPLAALVQPTPSSCATTNQQVSGSQVAGPGTYCGTSQISAGSSISFYPGTYIFCGSLSVAGTQASPVTLTGTGVTFFFTSCNGYNDGTLSTTYTTLNLTAPTSGTYAGILTMNSRSWTKTGNQDFSYSNTTFTGDGIWYLTGTGLSITNNSKFTANNYLGLDVDNLIVTSSTLNLESNFSGVSGGSPLAPQGGLVQ